MEEEQKKRPKYGGRKKGSVNKVTKEARELISEAVNMDIFRRRLAAIKSDAEYCKIVLKLMEFVLPKMKSIEVTGDKDKPLIIELPKQLSIKDIKSILDATPEEEPED